MKQPNVLMYFENNAGLTLFFLALQMTLQVDLDDIIDDWRVGSGKITGRIIY